MKAQTYTRILTIAGSDSGGCAGIQADLRVLHALKCHGTTVITAITAQNTQGVQLIHPIPANVVRSQMTSILEDIGVDAIKIGMLFNQEIIDVVVDSCRLYPNIPIVLDPVCAATCGDPLLKPNALAALMNKLMPLATLITPNINEAMLLMKEAKQSSDFSSLLTQLNVHNALVTGGDKAGKYVEDIWYEQRSNHQHLFLNKRLNSINTHGSGCSLSTAIAAYLGQGYQLAQAIDASIKLIRSGIKGGASFIIGDGAGPLCFW